MPSTSPVYLATPRSVPLAFDHQEGGGTPQPSPGTRVAPRLCSFLLVVTSERNAERLGFGERPGELQTRSCRVVVAVHAAVHPVGHSSVPFRCGFWVPGFGWCFCFGAVELLVRDRVLER